VVFVATDNYTVRSELTTALGTQAVVLPSTSAILAADGAHNIVGLAV
jgi:hypothetical protein